MILALKIVVVHKIFIEFLQNKYVDKIIFIMIGYFFKIMLDRYILNK